MEVILSDFERSLAAIQEKAGESFETSGKRDRACTRNPAQILADLEEILRHWKKTVSGREQERECDWEIVLQRNLL